MDTIESVNSKITTKFIAIIDTIPKISAIIPVVKEQVAMHIGQRWRDYEYIINGMTLNLIADENIALKTKYHFITANLLVEYYSNSMAASDTRWHTDISRRFHRTVNSECIISKVTTNVMKCVEICGQLISFLDAFPTVRAYVLAKELSMIKHSLESSSSTVTMTADTTDIHLCKCGAAMTTMPELSQMLCGECGKIKQLVGTVFRGEGMTEPQKSKQSNYDYVRHYKIWCAHLQAPESHKFEPGVIDRIKKFIADSGVDVKTLNCELTRSILKTLKLTTLNNYVPSIIRDVGGVPPPQLTAEENMLSEYRFKKAMRLYDIVKPDAQPTSRNKPYYPYFIYKIWEEMFKDQPRKLEILKYIHLQSSDTVVKNDQIFKKICVLAQPDDGLVYRSTDFRRRW